MRPFSHSVRLDATANSCWWSRAWVQPESPGVALPGDSARVCTKSHRWRVDIHTLRQSQRPKEQQQHSVAIWAQDSFINDASAGFWAGLGSVRCACLVQGCARSPEPTIRCLEKADTEFRCSLHPCRNSMMPCPSFLDAPLDFGRWAVRLICLPRRPLCLCPPSLPPS